MTIAPRWWALTALAALAGAEIVLLTRAGAFASPPLHAVWLGVAVLGLLLGSFYNVVILRLPPQLEWTWRAEARELLELPPSDEPAPPDLATKDSHCPRCGHALAPWENIPVVSFVLLRGRCRACQLPISWQYPAVELATATLFLATAWRVGWSPALPAALALVSLLLISAVIDLRTQWLPDALTLPALWLALLANAAGQFVPPETAILGAAIGYGSLWAIATGFRWATSKHGMGGGDLKLLAALGAWQGPHALLGILSIAVVLTGVVGGLTHWRHRGRRHVTLPFGPGLAMAGILHFLLGLDLVAWLQHLGR